LAAFEAALTGGFADLHAIVFWGSIVAVALWEHAAPLRALAHPLGRRWAVNFGLLAINGGLTWLIFPSAALAVAVAGANWNVGLLRWLPMPDWVAVATGFLLLDLARYISHLALHRVPLLWRLHRMHHTDGDFDITTGFRFHPLETLAGLGFNSAVILLTGAPVVAVLLYQLAFPLTSFWAHANARLAPGVERRLRMLLVTPDMHRIHHSVRPAEQDSNFGGMFTAWDRLFGTYVAAPVDGHAGMRIGLDGNENGQHLGRMLADPFIGGR
jgi:sterol desaturase/sphingolipid hydroxylase (fatty acid hydroxylase superfamily)